MLSQITTHEPPSKPQTLTGRVSAPRPRPKGSQHESPWGSGFPELGDGYLAVKGV